MSFRRVLRSLIVLAAGIVVGVGTAVPAGAVVNVSYDFDSSAIHAPGYTSVQGDLTWYGAHKFIISGRVNDVCDGDGNGDGNPAEFGVSIVYGQGEFTDHLVEDDRGGCEGYGETFSKTYDRTRRILEVGLLACEVGYWRTTCSVRYKNNPYTG